MKVSFKLAHKISNQSFNFYLETDSEYSGWNTRRGCLTDEITCESSTCEACDENSCNSKIFPTDRHMCLQCSGSDCTETKSEYCSTYLPNSRECITLFDDGEDNF